MIFSMGVFKQEGLEIKNTCNITCARNISLAIKKYIMYMYPSKIIMKGLKYISNVKDLI